MSLLKYAKTCAKNISGCKLVFIAEAANVTAVTITSGEITALTGTGAFKQIEADDDTIIREQEKLDSRLEIIEHRVGFKVNKLSKDLNTLRDSIAAASPCGMLAIAVDNNGKAWLVGYSEEDGIKRPLYLGEDKDTTFQTPFEDDPSAEMNLKRTTGHIDLPFDATLTAAIIAGTAAFIDYTGWSPLNLTNLELWNEADEGVTITGSGVSDWDDISVNDYDSVQATDSKRPLNPAAVINGKSVIRFDGTDDYLETDSGIRTNIHAIHDFTMGIVVKKTSGAASSIIFASGKGGTNRIAIDYFDDDIRINVYDGTSHKVSGAAIKGSFYVLIIRYDAGTNTTELWINGAVQSGTNSAATDGTIATTIGILNNRTGNPLNGDIAEIVIDSSKLNSADRTSLENYLNNKYSIY